MHFFLLCLLLLETGFLQAMVIIMWVNASVLDGLRHPRVCLSPLCFMAYSTPGCSELLMVPESTASNFLPLKTVTIPGDDYKLDTVLFFIYCSPQIV